MCEMLSRRQVEIGLVPFGAIGMSIFSIDLYFASRGLPNSGAETLTQFMAEHAHWRVLADLALLAFFAGLYSVPMYALIQLRAPATHRARIIAANNILNAVFMIASSLIAGALLAAHFTIPEIFLTVGLLNMLVAGYVFLVVPEYLLRFVAFIVSRVVYRFRIQGDIHIPTQGPALLVCNHVSYMDVVLLMAASPRPIRFIMDYRIFKSGGLSWFFRLAKTIPIASRQDNPAIYEAAFKSAGEVLDDGELLCIFPEGGLTRDGRLQPFKGGVMKVIEGRPDLPVIPLALHNLWGSYFSHVEGPAMSKPFRRGLRTAVGLMAGEPQPASSVSPEGLRERVQLLLSAAAA